MTETTRQDFEALWEHAKHDPDNLTVKAKTSLTLDLSIENVLNRYLNYVEKAADDNKVSQVKFLDLKKQTKNYMKAIHAIDDGSFLDDLKDITDFLNPFD